jgi:hypothetical protein
MATNSKVFVSPGVYTSEVDLSFVAQSVGVTTLGIVGETLIGPAFEPIFITSFNEFETVFGGTSPEKFINTQIPKYEAAYITKAYLQQSNQLFVTRILGLSGYDAGPSWSIATVANVDPSTVGIWCLSSVTDVYTCETICALPYQETYLVSFSGCNNDVSTISYLSLFPQEIQDILYSQYEQFDGGTSTLNDDIRSLIFDVITNSNPFTAEDKYISYFGSIDTDDYNTLTNAGWSASTNVFGVPSVSLDDTDLESALNDPWYYALFNTTGNTNYSGYSFFTYVTDLTMNPVTTTTTLTPSPTPTPNPCTTPIPITPTTTTTTLPLNCYQGNLVLKMYFYTGTSFTEYDNVVVGSLRSRGVATYSTGNNPSYSVTGTSEVSLNMTGQYSSVLKNPYTTFGVNVTDKFGVKYFFETSFSQNDPEYWSKVFGVTNFQKPRIEVPVFAEENFQSWLNFAWRKGYIKGLNPNLIALDSAQSSDPNSIGWYLDKWQTPYSPFVVSELRGNKVYDLFRFYTISDGDGANTLIKISIINQTFNNLTFDILIRDYFDTDANPVVLEKFTNCAMDPGQNNYIANKVGTLDGEYVLNSKYVMVEMSEDAPIDALPCGFNGFNFRNYAGAQSPFPIIKGKYDFPGEVIYNPPFGLSSGNDDALVSSGDNVRRTYLGMSNSYGWDPAFFEYVGKRNPINSCDVEGLPFNYRSAGFHMDVNASGLTIGPEFSTSGGQRFICGNSPFITDPELPTNAYYRLFARKFTFLVQGGFDGWDIYREWRTNEDRFQIGRAGYLNGACPSTRYPNAKGWGAFKEISLGDGTQNFANTDYYAYLLGQQTFANPESTNINVFVTPGIDYVNNSNLVEDAINMIEFNRADSLYITTTPD